MLITRYSHFLLESNRIILKAISFDYLEDIFANFTSEITTFMYPKPAKKIQETAEFIHEAMHANESKKDIQLVIIEKESVQFLGCCGLHSPHGIDPEFGIWIKKSAFKNGYGLEAITALKTWADENLDCDYFIYPVDEKNLPSRNIAEKLGGVVHKKYQKLNQSGVELNIVEYRIERLKNEKSI